MYKFDSPLISALADQVLRGPTRLRLRQLLSVDFLLSVVTSERAYPFEFVCHALTGYRPRPGGDLPANGQLVDGETLRADLVLLAECLSENAGLPAAAWNEPLYSVAALAQRFDVSTKTIFRWRRRGLVGWRFQYDDHRTRLAFTERAIRRFVADNAAFVHRSSSFSQLTAEERANIITRAEQLVAAGQPTVNAVARTIATETGRAVETIRLILKHYDEAHARTGVFNRSKLAAEGDEQRLAVWEAYQDGAEITALADRFHQPVAWIYQTITHMRARELQSRKLEYIDNDEFREPDARARILDDPALAAPYESTPQARRRAPADLPPYLQQLFSLPLLTREGERALFRKMNYLKYLADQSRQRIDPETVRPTELDEIDALLEEANQVKGRITQANLRLVVSIAKRHAGPAHDFFEIVSDGNISLMRAVDKFDYGRGFKFSTYGSWAIMKNYARSIPEQRGHRERYQTGREELLDAIPGPRPDEPDDGFLPAVRATLDRMLDTLDDRERSILRQRYGLDDEQREPQTLEQIGRRFGVSKERVRQLEARAIARLRADFEPDVTRLLGP